MASKQSPAKVTLAMMKGKPIATSVPAFRYHASDDELEELYPSTDDEKQTTPESEKGSAKSSPCKSSKANGDGSESEVFEKCHPRSSSVDGSLSEGTPPTDPWKMFSDFRGKLTKTFEDKLSEIKSEKKSKRRKRVDSSGSDSDDLGEVTPTEDFVPEKQEGESSTSGIIHRRGRSSRFSGFTNIKTGLKAKKEDSVESGVEAAEVADDFSSSPVSIAPKDEKKCESTIEQRLQKSQRSDSLSTSNSSDKIFSRLKRLLLHQIVMLPIVLYCSYYFLPFPEYVIGFFAGIFVTFTVQKVILRVKDTLAAPVERANTQEIIVPFVEIPAAEEYAVVERFEGWLNELPYNYAHDNYHVARTNPVFFKLEGDSLRIMETRTRVAKRALWNEGQIVPKFTRKRVYSLKDAKIELLPDGLTRRRRWSKKYPICVTFGKKGVIESIDLDNASEDEATKTDGDKQKTIFEEEENEREERREQEQRDKEQEIEAGDDEIPMSQLVDTAKDVFADCRDEEDDDGGDEDESKLKIYVFGRTDRQKEEWYRRLVGATKFGIKRNSISSVNDTIPSSNSTPTGSTVGDSKNSSAAVAAPEITCEQSYNAYMSRYIDPQLSATGESGVSLADNDAVWLNALLGRILFDMHKSSETINFIQEKIQRKLSNIKLPYFMQSLLVTELVIGQGAPVIHKASKPVIDERGLSIDLDITYEGCLTMTIETKLNLMKLTRAGSVTSNTNDVASADKSLARSPMFDSDVEDSPETSTEEEDCTNLPCSSSGSKESTLESLLTEVKTLSSPHKLVRQAGSETIVMIFRPTQSSGRKFLNMVDKLAANRYFQHAAELSCVRRAMEGLSNTEIRLMVNVSSIKGCVTVNIPPPPADRVWYGFKPVPSMILTATPAVGEMAVNIGYVTKWIETKLHKEFERVVVLPNMDDLLISLCPNYPFQDA